MRAAIWPCSGWLTCHPMWCPEVEAFFVHYAGLDSKELRVVRRSGAGRARKLLKAGAKAFKDRR